MNDEHAGIAIISFISALCIFGLGLYIGFDRGINKIYAEAVKHNVGEWVIQADGKPTFRFKK